MIFQTVQHYYFYFYFCFTDLVIAFVTDFVTDLVQDFVTIFVKRLVTDFEKNCETGFATGCYGVAMWLLWRTEPATPGLLQGKIPFYNLALREFSEQLTWDFVLRKFMGGPVKKSALYII